MDEVQTGLGRTGKFFCFEHFDLNPDIITVSKALSGGFVPVGAVLTTDRIFASVYSSLERALKHSSTFGRNQLAMVAGLATLAAFDDEGIVERARVNGLAFAAALEPFRERYEMFHEVRGKGLMIGLEFGAPSQSPASAIQHPRTTAPAIFSQMMVVPLFHRHRILTQVAADNVNIIKLLPPLICGPEEIDYFVNALDDVLERRTPRQSDCSSSSAAPWPRGRASPVGPARTPLVRTPPSTRNGNGKGPGRVDSGSPATVAPPARGDDP